METNLKEQHNRDTQKEIDFERKEIESLREKRDKFIPEIIKLEDRLNEINLEVRKMEIDMDCRENKIKLLSDKFWKN